MLTQYHPRRLARLIGAALPDRGIGAVAVIGVLLLVQAVCTMPSALADQPIRNMIAKSPRIDFRAAISSQYPMHI